MLAYDFPLLSMFWTLMWWFLWVAWILLVIRVIADIFRSHDMGGGGKALWTLFVVIIPWLGVLAYLIARGGSMQTRDVERARAADDAMRTYVQQTAQSGSAADELTKLAALKDHGVITEAEFASQKAKLLA